MKHDRTGYVGWCVRSNYLCHSSSILKMDVMRNGYSTQSLHVLTNTGGSLVSQEWSGSKKKSAFCFDETGFDVFQWLGMYYTRVHYAYCSEK